MSDMFALAMPWWEFVLRALVVYIAVLLMVRLSGKRSVGQFTPFDLILVVLLGNAVQNSLLGDDTSLLGGLILAATLIGTNWLTGWITAHSKRADKVIEGSPVLLVRDGKQYPGVLKREQISQSDLEEAFRQSNCADISDVALAVLETDGKISVVGKDKS